MSASDRRFSSFLLRIPGALAFWKTTANSAERLADMRRDYDRAGLSEAETPTDPMALFEKWFSEAKAAGIREPNAMVLSTADATAQPSSRCVLLKACDARGFVFFTNSDSRKGTELAENPKASLLFPWIDLERQIIITGAVEMVTRQETEAYFSGRPIGSQIGAWASAQSTVIGSREVLEQRVAETMQRFASSGIPCPTNWNGYRVLPEMIEFWQGRRSRLHDRIRYRKNSGNWERERLAP